MNKKDSISKYLKLSCLQDTNPLGSYPKFHVIFVHICYKLSRVVFSKRKWIITPQKNIFLKKRERSSKNNIHKRCSSASEKLKGRFCECTPSCLLFLLRFSWPCFFVQFNFDLPPRLHAEFFDITHTLPGC